MKSKGTRLPSFLAAIGLGMTIFLPSEALAQGVYKTFSNSTVEGEFTLTGSVVITDMSKQLYIKGCDFELAVATLNFSNGTRKEKDLGKGPGERHMPASLLSLDVISVDFHGLCKTPHISNKQNEGFMFSVRW